MRDERVSKQLFGKWRRDCGGFQARGFDYWDIMKLILGYVETWWIFGCMIDFGWMKKLPHVQLEQHHVDIDLERNRSPTFKFVEVNSGIGEEWDGLPEVPDYPTRRSCKVSVRFDLTAFDFAFVTLCLFREVVDKGLFLQV